MMNYWKPYGNIIRGKKQLISPVVSSNTEPKYRLFALCLCISRIFVFIFIWWSHWKVTSARQCHPWWLWRCDNIMTTSIILVFVLGLTRINTTVTSNLWSFLCNLTSSKLGIVSVIKGSHSTFLTVSSLLIYSAKWDPLMSFTGPAVGNVSILAATCNPPLYVFDC
jgi:hypothetical protein